MTQSAGSHVAAVEASGTLEESGQENEPANWLVLEPHELQKRLYALALHVMITEEFDINKPLMEVGMDSIESVDFRNQIERMLPGVNLPGALILEYPTIVDLTEFLLQARTQLMKRTAQEAAAASAPSLPIVILDAELQDAEGVVQLPRGFIAPKPYVNPACDKRGAVLLTGATGFLGIHLLAELLERAVHNRNHGQNGHPSRVLVVIRAATAAAGRQRVVDTLASHSLKLGDTEMEMLDVLPTEDLSAPMLGLGTEGFHSLQSANVQIIIHNAAQVNWFKRYEQLRASNVLPTLELIKLAAELGAKFSYVSSISTLPLSNPELAIDEQCNNGWHHVNVLKMSGYSQTKWISEQLCFAAGRHGIPVSVFRMPFIIGHSSTGCMNVTDTPARMIEAVVELGEAPVTVQLDCVAVDVVARVTARVSLRPSTCGICPATGDFVDGDPATCVVHIATKFGKLGMEKIFEQLRQEGYNQIRWVSRSDWVQHALEKQTSAAPIQVFDRLFNRPALVNSMKVEELQALGVPLADVMEVTPRHIKAIIYFLKNKGRLPIPKGNDEAAKHVHGHNDMKRQITVNDEALSFDYVAIQQSCAQNPVHYHGMVAARNLHWYHKSHAAWVTWKARAAEGAVFKADELEDWASCGVWRGFTVPPIRTPFNRHDHKGNGDSADTHACVVQEVSAGDWVPWSCIMDDSAEPFYKWFVGGSTNAALNEVDRHIFYGYGAEVAHVVDIAKAENTSAPIEQRLTRVSLLVESSFAAQVLQRPPLNLQCGDRALLFLPTSTQQLIWTEACKKLGVIYSACTPGLVASALAERICELKPKVVITIPNMRNQRWASAIASSLNDFVMTQSVLDALQLAGGQANARRPSNFTLGSKASASWSSMGLALAISETIPVLQDTFGASRCVSLSAALDKIMQEVKCRLRDDFVDGNQGTTLNVLSRLEESIQQFCEERAASVNVQVLILDRESAIDSKQRSAFAFAFDGEWHKNDFGNSSCHRSSVLFDAARSAMDSEGVRLISKANSTVEDNLELDYQGPHVLADVWQQSIQPHPVEANFPLFVCFTSGSTTRPSGVVHCHGYAASVTETLRWSFGAMAGQDRLLAMSHPGWIVGQSYMYTAPLCGRITSIGLEGSPIRPSPTRFADVIQRHEVTLLKTGSTFLREVMSYPKAEKSLREGFNLSSLRIASFCGEPLSPQVQAFAMQNICTEYLNSYWSTEHGGITWTHCLNSQDQVLVANAQAWPLPWIQGEVLCFECGPTPSHCLDMRDEEITKTVEVRIARLGESGDVAITRPFPYLFRCIWGEADRVLEPGWQGDADTYLDRYWRRVNIADDSSTTTAAHPSGLPRKQRWAFLQRDWAMKHHGGGYTFHGRSDEVMNLCGMNVGTENIETALLRDKHLNVASPIGDVAVVGHPHAIYGEMPLAFVTLSSTVMRLREADMARLSSLVFEVVGNVGLQIIQVPELPKTHTGKIMRNLLRALIKDDRTAFLQAATAVRNPTCLRPLHLQLQEWRSLHVHFGSENQISDSTPRGVTTRGGLNKVREPTRNMSDSRLFEDFAGADSGSGESELVRGSPIASRDLDITHGVELHSTGSGWPPRRVASSSSLQDAQNSPSMSQAPSISMQRDQYVGEAPHKVHRISSSQSLDTLREHPVLTQTELRQVQSGNTSEGRFGVPGKQPHRTSRWRKTTPRESLIQRGGQRLYKYAREIEDRSGITVSDESTASTKCDTQDPRQDHGVKPSLSVRHESPERSSVDPWQVTIDLRQLSAFASGVALAAAVAMVMVAIDRRVRNAGANQ